jgi:hypothetical protein
MKCKLDGGLQAPISHKRAARYAARRHKQRDRHLRRGSLYTLAQVVLARSAVAQARKNNPFHVAFMSRGVAVTR